MAKKLPKVLSRDDVARLLETFNTKTITGLRNYVCMLFMYRAGLRISEVCNLAFTDVDIESDFIFVQQGKGNRDRIVPLDPELKRWCIKWSKVRPDSTYFVCTVSKSSRGNQMNPRQIRQALYNASENSGVFIHDNHKRKNVHPHVLRHTFATECLEEGFTVAEVKDLLGHANIQTSSIYLHCRPVVLKRKILARGEDAG